MFWKKIEILLTVKFVYHILIIGKIQQTVTVYFKSSYLK